MVLDCKQFFLQGLPDVVLFKIKDRRGNLKDERGNLEDERGNLDYACLICEVCKHN